jgi:hypothetical protein
MQMQITELERAILVAVEALQHGAERTYEATGWPIVLDEGVSKALILAELRERSDIEFHIHQLERALSRMVTLGWLRKEIKGWSHWPDLRYKRSDGRTVVSRTIDRGEHHEVLLDEQNVVIPEMMEKGFDKYGYTDDHVLFIE